ncbi:MAG: hypothetical protein WCO91_07605, partial [Gemmataceae bacterium]
SLRRAWPVAICDHGLRGRLGPTPTGLPHPIYGEKVQSVCKAGQKPGTARCALYESLFCGGRSSAPEAHDAKALEDIGAGNPHVQSPKGDLAVRSSHVPCVDRFPKAFGSTLGTF